MGVEDQIVMQRCDVCNMAIPSGLISLLNHYEQFHPEKRMTYNTTPTLKDIDNAIKREIKNRNA